MRQIDIEGYSANEILKLPDEQVDEFVLCGRPIVFRAGSAEILDSNFEPTDYESRNASSYELDLRIGRC